MLQHLTCVGGYAGTPHVSVAMLGHLTCVDHAEIGTYVITLHSVLSLGNLINYCIPTMQRLVRLIALHSAPLVLFLGTLSSIINPQRMREGYSTNLFVSVCICVCHFTTLEAALIYSAKKGHQWTAKGIIIYL